MSEVVLHGYWRSSAAYRLRIAMNLKGIAYRQTTHDLRMGAQRDPDYLAIAPHGLVPALEIEGRVLIESLAILEWIEQRWPSPALLPTDPEHAVTVRSIAALIACDIHPLNNLRVLNVLRSDLQATDEQVRIWIHRWTRQGFEALEALITRHGGRYAFGDTPTFADCCVVPQLYNGRRFGVDMSAFPRLTAAGAAASALEPVQRASPERQTDADC